MGGCPNNCVKPDLNDLGIVGEAKAEVERSGSQKALLVIGACTWLAYDIMRQSRGIEA